MSTQEDINKRFEALFAQFKNVPAVTVMWDLLRRLNTTKGDLNEDEKQVLKDLSIFAIEQPKDASLDPLTPAELDALISVGKTFFLRESSLTSILLPLGKKQLNVSASLLLIYTDMLARTLLLSKYADDSNISSHMAPILACLNLAILHAVQKDTYNRAADSNFFAVALLGFYGVIPAVCLFVCAAIIALTSSVVSMILSASLVGSIALATAAVVVTPLVLAGLYRKYNAHKADKALKEDLAGLDSALEAAEKIIPEQYDTPAATDTAEVYVQKSSVLFFSQGVKKVKQVRGYLKDYPVAYAEEDSEVSDAPLLAENSEGLEPTDPSKADKFKIKAKGFFKDFTRLPGKVKASAQAHLPCFGPRYEKM